jgi:group I intron endonuclease
MRGYIYCIRNLVNDKIYIGQTVKSLKERFNQHIYDSKRLNYPIYRAFKKYNIENFIIECIEHKDMDDKKELKQWLNVTEIAYIELFDTTNRNNGYNLTKGGDGSLGVKRSIECRKKISVSRLGDKNPMYGRHGNNNIFSKKINQYTMNGEFIKTHESMANASQELGLFTSNICKCCKQELNQTGNFRWSYESEELCIKDNPNKKKIKQLTMNRELIKIHNSLTEAAEEYDLYITNISKVCYGKLNSTGGFRWEFTE